MIKLVAISLLLVLLLPVYARKKFRRIGEYTKVEILRVTPRGIQILHSRGINYITGKKLSEVEKQLLASELEQYYKLKGIRFSEPEKKQKHQTEELKQLMARLPYISWTQLQMWGHNKTGLFLSDKDFSEKFKSAFSHAENKELCLKAIMEKAKKQYSNSLAGLSNKLCKMSPEKIDLECQRLFGVKYSDKDFRKILIQHFPLADNIDQFFNNVNETISFHAQSASQLSLDEDKKTEKQAANADSASLEPAKNSFGISHGISSAQISMKDQKHSAKNSGKDSNPLSLPEKNTGSSPDNQQAQMQPRKTSAAGQTPVIAKKQQAPQNTKVPVSVIPLLMPSGLKRHTYTCHYYAGNIHLASQSSTSMPQTFKTHIKPGTILKVEVDIRDSQGNFTETYRGHNVTAADSGEQTTVLCPTEPIWK